jgi:hypothetical protein
VAGVGHSEPPEPANATGGSLRVTRHVGLPIIPPPRRVLSGMIATETATGVTLRQEGQQDVLLRDEIEAMAGSGQSLMPEGLETDLTPQDLADLIAYLRGDRKR